MRRHVSKAGSHPQYEEKVHLVKGAHEFGEIAVYWDVQDYGAESEYLHGARKDLLGYL